MTQYSDILIIGGGVAGVTAAAELAEQCSVTLLEAESALAYHASGRSAAMFLENYGNDTVRALNRASAEHLHHADGGVLSPRSLMLVTTAETEAAFAEEARSFGLRRLGLDEAQAVFPILDTNRVTVAALREDAHDIDTDLLVQNARRRALSRGARIETGARVTAISRDGDQWRVRAGEREWTAGTLVNAAGAWADSVAALAGVRGIGLTPLRRSMARIPLPEGMDPSRWPFVDRVGEGWYCKPDAGALIVSPGDEDPSEPMDAWADDMVVAEGLARFEEAVTLSVTRLLATWAGLRTFAPDRTLVIGRAPDRPDFVWLAGQGGYGFQTGPAAAALVRALVTGETPGLAPDIVAALSPARFLP